MRKKEEDGAKEVKEEGREGDCRCFRARECSSVFPTTEGGRWRRMEREDEGEGKFVFDRKK